MMTQIIALNVAVAQGDSARFFYSTKHKTKEDEKKFGKHSGPRSNTEILAVYHVPIPKEHQAAFEALLKFDQAAGSPVMRNLLIHLFVSGKMAMTQ